MLEMVFTGLCTMGDELYITIPAIIISSFAIYKFNYKFTFKNFEANKKYKLSLIFAVITAPYTFLVPSNWLYY